MRCCCPPSNHSVRILLGGELRGEELHFGPARSLLLGTLVVCATTFALFYEAAFILNSISTGLISPVSGLSDAEMCRWTVLRGAATEDIFVELVNEGRGSGARATVGARSWSTCDTVHECIERVVNGSAVTAPRCEGAAYTTTEVYLSWKTTILAEFRANTTLCQELDVVDADEAFFRFNVAWHFADVNASAPGRWHQENSASAIAPTGHTHGSTRGSAPMHRTTPSVVLVAEMYVQST